MKALVYNDNAVRWLVCKLAGFISKRVFYSPMAPLRLVELPRPELPGPEWVRLKTTLGGVCGTDLAIVAQRGHPASIVGVCSRFPAVLGHENVAVIDEVGCDVADWSVGQRVCVEPAVGCRAHGEAQLCNECKAGRNSLCQHHGNERLPNRTLVGLNTLTGGSWSEYFLAHRSQLFAVPNSLSDDAAVLVDPIASATHAVLRRPPQQNESVLVNGSGIIAIGIITAIRALGYSNRITMTARHPFQVELAKQAAVPPSSAQIPTDGNIDVLLLPRSFSKAERYEIVAKHVGGKRISGRFGNQMLLGGFDLTYDCTGSGQGTGDALKWTRPRGTVVAVGTSGIILLETSPIWFDELTVIGANGRQIESVNGRTLHTYSLVLEWLVEGRLNLSAFPATRYRLYDYAQAIHDLLYRGKQPIIKAAFQP